MRGYLELTMGPMFSGKTTFLIDKLNRFVSVMKQRRKNFNALVINYSEDTRSKNVLSPHDTHKKIVQDDRILQIKANSLRSFDIKKFDYIAIDEAQFFDDIDVVLEWLENPEIHVHCCGLIADSDRKPFGKIPSLLHRADKFEQLKSFCVYCGDKELNAPFTRCLNHKTTQKQIGGLNDYIAVCGKHYSP